MVYEISRFIDNDFLEDFKCSVCLEILKDPVFVKCCEHIYCRACIELWLETDTSCPKDRKPIEAADLVEPFRFFRNLYDKLKIRCDFAKVGCEEFVSLSGLEEHVAKCEFSRTDCIKGCGFFGLESEFESNECIRFLVGKMVVPEKENLRMAFEKVKTFLSLDESKEMTIWDHFWNWGNSLFRYEPTGRHKIEIKKKLAEIVVGILLEYEKEPIDSFKSYGLQIKVRASQELSTKFYVIVGDSFSCLVNYRDQFTYFVGNIKIVFAE